MHEVIKQYSIVQKSVGHAVIVTNEVSASVTMEEAYRYIQKNVLELIVGEKKNHMRQNY